MAKVSELGAASALGGTEQLPVVQSATSKRSTVDDFATYLSPCIVPTRSAYGALGDGTTDDTTAIGLAFAAGIAAGVWVDGKGLTYGVTGSVNVPEGLKLRNITLKQLAPTTSNCRTLSKTAGTGNIVFDRVKIDRGSNKASGGNTSNFAGIWLANQTNVQLIDCEVTGDGPGTGILLSACINVSLVRPSIHDMTWSAGTDPGTEQIVGIRWANACTKVRIVDPYISKLGGLIGTDAIRYYQTDGIDPGGSGWSIRGGYIEYVGEAIDTHASEGNFNFLIEGVQLSNIDSHGFKIGNYSQRGVISGCIAADCGLTGFVFTVSGTTNPVRDLTIVGCKAINTGSNGNWSSSNVAGMAILGTTSGGAYADNLRFIECQAIDIQGSPTMKYGFRCEPALSTSQVNMNVLRGFKTSGATTSAITGFIGEFECSVTRSTAQTLTNSTDTAIVWNNTDTDPYVMSAGSGVIKIKEAGLYNIDVGVELTGNATGSRSLTIYLNGVATTLRTFLPGSSACNQSLKLSAKMNLALSDQLTFHVQQDSGGDLDTIAGESYVIVSRDYGAL